MGKKKILIIGLTSFIGFNFALYLKKKGYLVYGITSSQKKKSIQISRLQILKRNKIKIYKKNLLLKKSFVNLDKFQIIINAIGWTKNFNNKNFNYSKVSNNYKLFYQNLLYFIRINNPDLLIEIGSSSEYGKSKLKFSENSKCYPDSDYGKLKLKNSILLKKLSTSFNFSVIILRVFSIFGILDRKDKLIEYIKNNKKLIINKPFLKQDFISIEYLNKIVRAVITRGKFKNFNIYNCCSGIGISPMEIINLLPKSKLKEKTINFKFNKIQKIDNYNKTCIGLNKKIIKDFKLKQPKVREDIKKYLSK